MPKVASESKTPTEASGENADAIHFDVAGEAWIEVLRADGTGREVGLIEALCEAHLLRTVRDPLPPVECALLRLLVAFALDIFAPKNAKDWGKVWDAGCFDQSRVRDYFERYADRFDLFDATHPFLQDGAAGGDDKPLAGLLPSQPAGTNAAHFHHGDETEFAVSPAIAARLLAAVPPFMTAGGAGLSPSINGAPPWYVMLQGENLFQTIWLNCPVISDIAAHSETDCPAWRDERPLNKEDRSEAGLLEALTWRPRRIRLMPHFVPDKRGLCALSGRETPLLVARMKFSAAWSTRFEWRDPNVARRISKDGVTVLRPRENRAVWRDAGALAFLRHNPNSGDVSFERPGIVTQFAQFVENSARLPQDTPLRLAIYGMRTDMKMKIFEWHREQLTLPAPLLWKRDFHNRTEAAMKIAEDVSYALKQAIRHTYPRDGAGNDKAFDTLVLRAQNEFWQRLRPHYAEPPDSLLYRLAPLQPERDAEAIEAAVERWHKTLGHIARQTLDGAIGDLDTDGEAMKRQAEAQRIFQSRLWALFNPVAAAAAREKKKKEKTNE